MQFQVLDSGDLDRVTAPSPWQWSLACLVAKLNSPGTAEDLLQSGTTVEQPEDLASLRLGCSATGSKRNSIACSATSRASGRSESWRWMSRQVRTGPGPRTRLSMLKSRAQPEQTDGRWLAREARMAQPRGHRLPGQAVLLSCGIDASVSSHSFGAFRNHA